MNKYRDLFCSVVHPLCIISFIFLIDLRLLDILFLVRILSCWKHSKMYDADFHNRLEMTGYSFCSSYYYKSKIFQACNTLLFLEGLSFELLKPVEKVWEMYSLYHSVLLLSLIDSTCLQLGWSFPSERQQVPVIFSLAKSEVSFLSFLSSSGISLSCSLTVQKYAC